MPPPSPKLVAADACFLINFLVVDRMDLLAALGGSHLFRVPLEVTGEVLRPEEARRLNEAFAAGILEAIEIQDLTELATLADLLRMAIGAGEAACLTLAVHRGWSVASDERGKFLRVATDRIGREQILTTPMALSLAVAADVLTGEEARAIADELRRSHRFAMAVPDDW